MHLGSSLILQFQPYEAEFMFRLEFLVLGFTFPIDSLKRVLCSTSAPSMASINMLRHLLLNINDPAKVSLKVFKAQHGLLAEDRLRRLTNTNPGSAITSKLSF